MPLVLVAIPLSFILVWIVLFGMHQGSNSWLTPLVRSLIHPHGSFLTRVALKAAGRLLQGAVWVITEVQHAISAAAAHGMYPVAHWFRGHAHRETAIQTTNADFADTVARTIEAMVHYSIPHAINAKTIPLHRGIDANAHDLHRLRSRLAKLALGIDTLLGARLLLRVHHVEHATTQTLPRAIARDRVRIRGLERARAKAQAGEKRVAWAGAFAGAAALVWFVLKKWDLRWLRCTKVTRVGKLLCGMNSSLFDALFLGAFEAFAVLDICDMVRIIEQSAEQFEPVLRGIVIAEDDLFSHCGYDLPSAADKQGYNGGWLSAVPD